MMMMMMNKNTPISKAAVIADQYGAVRNVASFSPLQDSSGERNATQDAARHRLRCERSVRNKHAKVRVTVSANSEHFPSRRIRSPQDAQFQRYLLISRAHVHETSRPFRRRGRLHAVDRPLGRLASRPSTFR